MIDIKRLYPLIDELRQTTGKRLALSPSTTLAIRAQVTSEPYDKKVIVSYRPDKCRTGDIAHEILRSVQAGSQDWGRASPIPVDSFDKRSLAAANWIQTVVNDVWVEERLRRLGTRSRIHNDIMDANLETLERDERPYPGIADPNMRQIYSTFQYASFLLTRRFVPYGRKGDLFHKFYSEREPRALNLGIRAAHIVRRHRCLSPITAARAAEELIHLSAMGKRLRLQGSR